MVDRLFDCPTCGSRSHKIEIKPLENPPDTLNLCTECGKPTHRDEFFSLCIPCVNANLDKLLERKRGDEPREISGKESKRIFDAGWSEAVKHMEANTPKRESASEIRLHPDVQIMTRLSAILSRDTTSAKKLDEIVDLYAPYLKREMVTGWQAITFDEKGTIGNTPKHEQEVLFVYGESVYAGCFLDDIRESHYPDGEEYEGEFGFYTMDDKFYETEHVSYWMPSPIPPKKTEIEDGAGK